MAAEATGVVLAGGRSERMRADKSAVEVTGRPMIAWVIAALDAACTDVVVAGRPEGFPGVTGIADPEPGGRGPLNGLVGAMRSTTAEWLVAVGVDQPWLRPRTVSGLVRMADHLPVVPVADGVRQTTCAVYPTSLVAEASDELAEGGSLQSFLDRVAFDPVVESEWRRWGEDGRSWYSVDTPQALVEGLHRYGPPGRPAV